MKAELLFSRFICEPNLPIATVDHLGELFKAMFSDSKIAKKYSCRQTKTTHILSGAVAKESISDLKSTSDLYKWFGLATDGSSDENDKFLPIILFCYLGIPSRILSNHRTARERGGHLFTSSLPFPHASHTLRDISRATTAESLPLHISSSRTRTRNL